MLSLILGFAHRRLAAILGDRGVPHRATDASILTQSLEPESVRHIPAGPPEHLVRVMPSGSPADHPRFAAGQRTEIPARYVLSLVRGRTVGDYCANITRNGILDYETSGYFGLSSWREHPIYLRTLLPKPRHVPGRVLNLSTRGCSSNYYHFMLDALPRYGIFLEAMPDTTLDAVIVPHATRYQRELLDLIGVPGPWLQPGHNKAWTADELIIPSTPNQELGAPQWVTQWLRERLRANGPSELSPYLYITRGDKPHTRIYREEDALWPHLESRGFSRVDPGSMSVQEQINSFSAARIVVAPHGAGLTNILFCAQGTDVLELFAPDYVHLGLWSIAESVGCINYSYLVGDGSPARADVGVLSDISIPPTKILAWIDEKLRETPAD